ncbi:uncharacterized protein LOC123550138 [Mercenaria mercenaria]|uniref:uncharacterized protein LOC123550138 n=1 Tax=Mercenaria mercenaria TaxID=6596 RepID=UPI00234E7DDB|nr:uncharacterized protein LOC123550138 [Mercenaria mercenaria]
MRRKDRDRTMLGTFSEGVRLPELIRQLDRFMITSEKKCAHDTLSSFDEELKKAEGKEIRRSDRMVADFTERLCNQSLSNEDLRTVLKIYQYHLHEVNILEDLYTNDSSENKKIADRSTEIHLPKISKSKLPLRPTALLDRVLDKHKMKEDIVIPTMVLKDKSSCRTSDRSAQSRESKHEHGEIQSKKKTLPHFNYEHGEGKGTRRNLPGQPELIRLLTDPEISLGGGGGGEVSHSGPDLNRTNSLLSLYGGTLSPPLIDKQKQRKPRKRRIVCKFCRRPPGDHQKWCIYYDFGKITEEPPLELSRSHTQDEIDLAKDTKTKDNIQELERSKTSLDEYMIRPDLPDYRPLHRDVYIRALADSRARLVMHRTNDFANQLTQPFVFSYFSKLNGPRYRRNKINGMKNIFGEKSTDFTEYYKLFVNEIKQGNS